MTITVPLDSFEWWMILPIAVPLWLLMARLTLRWCMPLRERRMMDDVERALITFGFVGFWPLALTIAVIFAVLVVLSRFTFGKDE